MANTSVVYARIDTRLKDNAETILIYEIGLGEVRVPF